ncbi:hypothetical protein HNQ77_004814 [Silvibacterium bohemicum]|uniref:Uncharacterized protein n=1 Tax=Silvibacterium bohemicum TaxID=1577686 RepID=A0A841JZC2_9BACT|nr:hypothetical protein [Silvibacterium bohemicum]MBB6146833.1 hypothetical protein [Silvibacterium bohemicum]
MRRIELKITFIDDDGTTREESQSAETSYTPDSAGEHRLAHNLATEMKVIVGEQAEPKHNGTARGWLEFPGVTSNIAQYFDVRNSQAIWFELTKLIMGAEGDLVLAQTYKALEPSQEPPFEDDLAINDLYYIHDRKMTLLNQSIQDLIKVQDLVNRLLHESLGGDLVDTSKPTWEKSQLTRENVAKRLETRRANGAISQADFDAITQALAIPSSKPGADIAIAYRNRLMHHMRPSVDYSMFFSSLESRTGEEVKDAQGKVVRRVHTLRTRPPVEYRFSELVKSCAEYLDAVVAMLERLSQIELLRR